MMKLIRLLPLPLALLFTLSVSGCGGGDGGGSTPPPTIDISGTVTSAADGLLIGNAQVTLVNIETQQNERDPVLTDVNGSYSFRVSPGTYEVRTAAQGYKASPLDGISGIPVTQTAIFDVGLEPITDPGVYGWLNLQLVGYSKTNGALVILTDTVSGDNYTGETSITGDLMMYNLPAATYNLTIKSIGHETYTSVAAAVEIIDSTETVISDILLTAIDGFSVSGTVTLRAITNSEVDVSLIDIGTGAVIPGTNVNTVNTNYIINSVAPGDYYIRATFNIDGVVVDPDAIVKFGEPDVNVAAVNVIAEVINVTGAVILTSPIVPANGTPFVIDTLPLTFSWEAYPSTTDYVVEVRDAHGNVIWGGFADDAVFTKQVMTTETSIGYLGPTLEDGAVYRWKVYASKNDASDIGWDLISVSEEAQGVFKVVLP